MQRLALAFVLAAAGWNTFAAEGEKLFASKCAVCHQTDGRGILGVYPPLAGHVGRFVHVPTGRAYLVRVLSFGLFGAIKVQKRPYHGFMPAHPTLKNGEIADVVNYVLIALSANELPPDFKPLTPSEVRRYREEPATPSQVRKERGVLLVTLRDQSKKPAKIPKITGIAEDYSRECQGCHRADGMGAPGAVPRLRHFVGYFTHLPEGREFLMRVPGVASAHLDDARLTALLNWMLLTFSRDELAPDFQPFTADEIGLYRKNPIAEVVTTRKRLIEKLKAAGVIKGDDDGLGVSPERQ